MCDDGGEERRKEGEGVGGGLIKWDLQMIPKESKVRVCRCV